MKFKDLLNKYSDEEIVNSVKNIYYEDKWNKNTEEGYFLVLKELRETDPINSDFVIKCEKSKTLFDEEEDCYDIYGCTEKDKNNFGLSFTDWKEWLGSSFDCGDLAEIDFLGECLFEMTFHGFSNEDVQNSLNSILDELENVKNDKTDLISYDELKKELINYDI